MNQALNALGVDDLSEVVGLQVNGAMESDIVVRRPIAGADI